MLVLIRVGDVEPVQHEIVEENQKLLDPIVLAHVRRYLITSIRLRLNRCFTPCLEYQGLRDELRSMEITQAGPKQVSDAIIRIRKRKLPDPTQLGNAGSFFKNPIVSANLAAALQQQYPGLPGWQTGPEHLKLSARWMIEYCGRKGFRLGATLVFGLRKLKRERAASITVLRSPMAWPLSSIEAELRCFSSAFAGIYRPVLRCSK